MWISPTCSSVTDEWTVVESDQEPNIWSRWLRGRFKNLTSVAVRRKRCSLSAARLLLSKDDLPLSLRLSWESGYSPMRLGVWADACHCVRAINASWHVIQLELPLLLAVRRVGEHFKSAWISAKSLFNAQVSLPADRQSNTQLRFLTHQITQCNDTICSVEHRVRDTVTTCWIQVFHYLYCWQIHLTTTPNQQANHQ